MERTLFHIDVNNAFLSWEAVKRLKENPDALDLRTVPSVIAGSSQSRRGIVLAKSTPAKKFGIVTGEPVFSAQQKCPHLICVSPDFELYHRYSQQLFSLLSNYSDRIEVFSIDECFLEYTGMEEIFGAPLDAAQRIRNHIKTELKFTVNIGISTNKLLAKMAGELEKPDKIHTMYPHEIKDKLWPQPVEQLFMVGRRTAQRLKRMNIQTIGDLAHTSSALLEKEFKSFGALLYAYANGIESSMVSPADAINTPKSIGNSTTLPKDVTDAQGAFGVLLALSDTVASRLRKHGLCAEEITITIKSSDFQVYSHQCRISDVVNCTNAIYKYACKLFLQAWKGEPIRLLGVRAGRLCPEEGVQLSLFAQDWSKEKKADKAMDAIRLKYGKQAVCRSSLLLPNLKNCSGGHLQINPNSFR
ncbi:MAG: DNA polymerase IV [Epulopiscium sp.]|jgi:DNA polymerase-4|nr:DNA polymerase IV [Candidatus Epulonipiscium sp.]